MNSYLKLAKQAIEAFIRHKNTIAVPTDLSKEMTSEKAGVFVTIHKGEELRGCIGTFLPAQENIAKEIIENAIAAATKDYRFNPITSDELPKLNYEVNILEKPEQVTSLDQLDAKKYGLLVRTEYGKSGLLLPDLKEVDTPAEQISICCQKGNINPEKEKLILYRFRTTKYK